MTSLNRSLLLAKAIFGVAALGVVSGAAYAQSGEGHFVASGGAEWADDESSPIVGAAVGYDFNWDKFTFIGAEVGVDKALNRHDGSDLAYDFDDVPHSGHVSVSLIARAGMTLSAKDKLYGLGGIALHAGESEGLYGAGFEHRFGKFLANIEYKYAAVSKANRLSLGLGIAF